MAGAEPWRCPVCGITERRLHCADAVRLLACGKQGPPWSCTRCKRFGAAILRRLAHPSTSTCASGKQRSTNGGVVQTETCPSLHCAVALTPRVRRPRLIRDPESHPVLFPPCILPENWLGRFFGGKLGRSRLAFRTLHHRTCPNTQLIPPLSASSPKSGLVVSPPEKCVLPTLALCMLGHVPTGIAGGAGANADVSRRPRLVAATHARRPQRQSRIHQCTAAPRPPPPARAPPRNKFQEQRALPLDSSGNDGRRPSRVR